MNNEINYVSPFKKFVITVGNLPTAYMESMSYYEAITFLVNYLSNNVIPALNNNGLVVEELQAKFTELKNYVDNYFENLDVQEEINNKLDEMVEDGTLEALIGAYIQPRIDEQNENIESFKTNINQAITSFEDDVNDTIDDFEHRLDSATSGSPLVASSVSGMTDTTRAYVNTADGKWYYYDGDSWEIGGTYQSTELASGSVTYETLDNSLKQDLGEVTETTDDLPISGKYVEDNGNVIDHPAAGFYAYSIDVEPFETYILDIYMEAYRYGNNTPLYAFKGASGLVSKLTKADAVSGEILVNNHFHVKIQVPYNANKLNINTSGQYLRNYIIKVKKYQVENIHKEQLDSKLQVAFSDEYTEVEPTLFVDGGYIESLYSTQNVAGFSIYEYDVEPGEKYSISVKQFYNNPFIVYTTNNQTRTVSFNNGSYTMNEFMAQEKDTSTGTVDIVDFVFTIPEYCSKIYINKMNSSPTLSLKKSTSYMIKLDDIDMNHIKNEVNPLNEKKIMFTGDSITAASTTGVKGYTGLIADNNPTATIYNYGVDGATIAVESDNPTKNVVSYIQTMHTQHADADYIIIQGGVNDFYKLIPLGTFSEHSNFNGETPYDTSTFSGALEWIFHYCLTNFGGKKVGYIVTQKTYSGPNFYQYMDRAKAICKKWCIPYIDLYEESDLNFAVTYQKANYSITNVDPTGDGLHPNLAGYEIITPKIENWIKYKM